MLQGSLHLILQTHSNTHSPPSFFLRANLSDLSHPRAFSSICPSWTPVHLSSSGGIPHGSAWSLALQLGLTPSWGWGGRDSAPRQQQSVKSVRLWQEDRGDMHTRTQAHTHTHTKICVQFCENYCENIHRALKLILKQLFCIKIKVTQSQLNANLFIKNSPVIKWKQRIINEQSARVSEAILTVCGWEYWTHADACFQLSAGNWWLHFISLF